MEKERIKEEKIRRIKEVLQKAERWYITENKDGKKCWLTLRYKVGGRWKCLSLKGLSHEEVKQITGGTRGGGTCTPHPCTPLLRDFINIVLQQKDYKYRSQLVSILNDLAHKFLERIKFIVEDLVRSPLIEPIMEFCNWDLGIFKKLYLLGLIAPNDYHAILGLIEAYIKKGYLRKEGRRIVVIEEED